MGANSLVFILSVQIITFGYASFKFEKVLGECQNIGSTHCIPRTTIINLTSSDPNITYLPSAVEVKRCSDFGKCGVKSCVPIDKKLITIPVKQIDLFTTRKMCGKIHIEEHVKCRCRCSTTKSDCHPRHVFDWRFCRCKCLGYNEEIEKCNQHADKIWDLDVCECRCYSPMVCPTGLEWDENDCQCVPEQW